jgi:hypothetical protein
MIDQFSSLQNNCSTALPYSISVTKTTLSQPTSHTSDETWAVPTFSADVSQCTGQVVHSDEKLLPCDVLSLDFNVSTGALRKATGDIFCIFTGSLCLPSPCPVKKIYGGTW